MRRKDKPADLRTCVYRYQMRVEKKHGEALDAHLKTMQHLYNRALAHRDSVYNATRDARAIPLCQDEAALAKASRQATEWVETQIARDGLEWIGKNIEREELSAGLRETVKSAWGNGIPVPESISEEAFRDVTAMMLRRQVKGDIVTLGELKKLFITAPRQDPTDPAHAYLIETTYSEAAAALTRLDRAYQAFYRRAKNGEFGGKPRFKRLSEYSTLEYDSYGNGCKLEIIDEPRDCDNCKSGVILVNEPPPYPSIIGELRSQPQPKICSVCNGSCVITKPRAYVKLSGIGRMRLIYYRPLPEGYNIRNISVTREVNHWFVNLILEYPFVEPEKNRNRPEIGIDFGIREIVGDNGEIFPVTRRLENAQKELAERQQYISRAVKGSNRRRKAVKLLAKTHLRVRIARKHWHREIAKFLATRYSVIHHEQLCVQAMARRPKPILADDGITYLPNGATAHSNLTRGLLDLSPYAFGQALDSACQQYGSTHIPKDPVNTTRECARCGAVSPVPVKGKVFVCTTCGHQDGRKINAAKVIKKRAVKPKNVAV